MPDFTYEALAKTGQRNNGTLTATTEREAAAMLDARGLFPIRIAPIQSSASRGFGSKKVKGKYMSTLYSQLADLLHSGVPLLRALDILERQSTQPVLSEVLREVRTKVADGIGLAEAMKPYPNVFNELSVSMIKAGQEGGFLEDVLKRIAIFTEHQEDLKGRVVGALAYPIFLAITGFIVLAVLILGFVPRFEPIFKKLEDKGELPSITIGLLGVSNFMLANWFWMVCLVVVAWFAFRRWKNSPSGRYRMDKFRLKIPGAGTIFLNFALSRFTRILGTLLKNGIPILNALNIAKDSTGNKVLAEAIEKSAENITAGQKLAAPLRACPYFPKDIVEMVEIAEESNSLETVLVDIADGLEKRTSRQLDLFVRLLEPLMLLVMAAVTLLVVAGLLLPVFKMSSTLK